MTRGLRHAAILIGVITLARLAALALQGLELGADEAQYWAWAQAPAFGYFSKPPVIAWLIAFTTWVAGDGEFGVRLAAPLLHAATAFVLYELGRTLYDTRTALWSALAYVTLPAVSFASALISTDTPLLFFWALALLGLARALEDPTLKNALLIGGAIGFGLLSKYAMIYFPLCAVIAAVFVPKVRGLVFSRFGLIALATAAVIFSPNVFWNAAHGFPTFAHTAANANLGGSLFHPNKLLEFFGAQFGIFGPILFATLLFISAGLGRTDCDTHGRLLGAFCLPIIVFACVVALVSRANANWAAPAYIAAVPLVVHWLLERGQRLLFTVSMNLHAIIAVLIAATVAYPGIADLVGQSNSLKRVRGWSELGAALSLKATEAPYTAILADDRELMGELLYYVRPRKIPVVMWDWERHARNHYELANRIDETTGARALFVSLTAAPDDVLRRFARTEPLGPLTVRIDGQRTRTVYLFDLEGFTPRPN